MATLRDFELYRSIASDRISDLHLGRNAAGEVVAIRMYGSRPAAEPALVESVIAAARKTIGLDVPGLVRVLAVSDAPPHFVATEFPAGVSLRTVLDEAGPLPPLLAARLGSEIAKVLDALHELRDEHKHPRGLVHGALCPENVFVTWDGAVKLADLGAPGRTVDARAGDSAPTVSRYMAPEQAIGARVDRRTDVFSLGVVLWEALTGDRLFDAPTPSDLVTKITIDEIPAARSRNRDVPEKLSAITSAALVRSLVRRTPTAAAMHRELDAFLTAAGAGTDHATFLGELMKAGFAEHRAKREDQIAHLPPPGRVGTAPQTIAEAPTQPAVQLPAARRDPSEASIIVDPELLEDLDEPATPPAVVHVPKPQETPTPVQPSPAPGAPPPPPPPQAPSRDVVPSAPPPTTPAASDLPDTTTFSRPRGRFFLVVLLVIVGAGAVAYALWSWERSNEDAISRRRPVDTGAMLVRSDPEGAHVIVDGKDTGKRTPARIDGLALDQEHSVLVHLDGYVDWATRATALAEERMLHAMLVPEGAAGNAQAPDAAVAQPPSTPGATASEHPRTPAAPGTTPAKVPRGPGGGGGLVRGGSADEAAAEDMGFLTVRTNAHAYVSFDGRRLGRAPIVRAHVPAGTHGVRVTFDDGADEVSRDARVQIQPGWEFTLRVDQE